MKLVKDWCRMAARLMAAVFVVSFAGGTAFGQALRVEIPYPFAFGGKVLPPAIYTFRVSGVWLIARSDSSGPFNNTIISSLGGPSELFRDGSLVFEKSESGRILSEVWIPGSNGIQVHSEPKDQTRDVLLISELNKTKAVSGKTAFSQTCGKCHGSDGKGDTGADKFFKITIPRLNSAAVQRKSDAEFRELIAKGSSVMPPVEINESGFQHRLPPQDVDAVIAYVRTLKQ